MMQRVQFSKAEPIVEKIRNLEKLKNSFGFPAECYHIEFRTSSKDGLIANSSDISNDGMRQMVDKFKSICDENIKQLEKALGEI